MLKYKEEILDDTEKAMFLRADDNSEYILTAKHLLSPDNDLKEVKIH